MLFRFSHVIKLMSISINTNEITSQLFIFISTSAMNFFLFINGESWSWRWNEHLITDDSFRSHIEIESSYRMLNFILNFILMYEFSMRMRKFHFFAIFIPLSWDLTRRKLICLDCTYHNLLDE